MRSLRWHLTYLWFRLLGHWWVDHDKHWWPNRAICNRIGHSSNTTLCILFAQGRVWHDGWWCLRCGGEYEGEDQ